MRLESLIIGIVVLAFGILLVSTNGNVAGVNLPGLIGIHSCSSGTNSTCSGFDAFGGLGVGTLVAIFGLTMIANGLRGSSAARGRMAGPQLMAGSVGMSSVAPAYPQGSVAATSVPTIAAVPARVPGVRYCPSCGGANQAGAKFCQHCADPMPATMANQGSGSSTPPPSGGPPPSETQ